jgi:hypothetical protein
MQRHFFTYPTVQPLRREDHERFRTARAAVRPVPATPRDRAASAADRRAA